MFKIANHKNQICYLIFTTIFLLLTASITKDAVRIYSVSSQNQLISVPIIMYHQVKNTQLGKDVISLYEFESDLKYLAENKYNTITMSDLIDYVYHDEPLPDNPIILSFDDGYLTTYKYVYPLLQKYNMKIVLSIVGKSVDDFTKVHDENIGYAHITWEQVKEMQNSGLVEIQNHTYNMHKVSCGRYGCGQKYNESLGNYKKSITEDIRLFQSHMEAMTNTLPTTFTYPYGKYNDNTEAIVRDLGYKATLSCQFGVNLINRDPDRLFGLKRMCRSHNYSIGKLIKDGMETLKYVNQ